MSASIPENFPANFTEAVEEKVEDLSAPEAGPGKFAAAPRINWDAIRAGIAKADEVIQRAAPVVESFTPAQYDVIIAAVAAAVHGVNAQINPAA
jgi:hypothetical protein